MTNKEKIEIDEMISMLKGADFEFIDEEENPDRFSDFQSTQIITDSKLAIRR